LSQKNESRKQADSSEACRKAKVCLLFISYNSESVIRIGYQLLLKSPPLTLLVGSPLSPSYATEGNCGLLRAWHVSNKADRTRLTQAIRDQIALHKSNDETTCRCQPLCCKNKSFPEKTLQPQWPVSLSDAHQYMGLQFRACHSNSEA